VDHTQRIDDRGGVHPELDNEGEEDGEVAILGGHGRYKDTKAETETSEHDNHRKENGNADEDVDKYRSCGDDHTHVYGCTTT